MYHLFRIHPAQRGLQHSDCRRTELCHCSPQSSQNMLPIKLYVSKRAELHISNCGYGFVNFSSQIKSVLSPRNSFMGNENELMVLDIFPLGWCPHLWATTANCTAWLSSGNLMTTHGANINKELCLLSLMPSFLPLLAQGTRAGLCGSHCCLFPSESDQQRQGQHAAPTSLSASTFLFLLLTYL